MYPNNYKSRLFFINLFFKDYNNIFLSIISRIHYYLFDLFTTYICISLYMNLIISDEQRIVIEKIKDNNVVVNSCAGSGKTTTILFIAKEYP
jgi:hypothetical protein